MRYLNVGNPPAFGFQPPEHMIAAVERAMRAGQNGYGPSSGVESAPGIKDSRLIEALFEAVRIPRQIVVHHQIGVLQVHALARGIGGKVDHGHMGNRRQCCHQCFPPGSTLGSNGDALLGERPRECLADSSVSRHHNHATGGPTGFGRRRGMDNGCAG